MKTLSLPERMLGAQTSIIAHTKKPLGATVEVYVHEIARKLPAYNQPVECEAVGIDSDENKIQVDTLGRWLFGVPGYQGHLRIVAGEEIITIYYPSDSPKIVEEFLRNLKEAIESSHK